MENNIDNRTVFVVHGRNFKARKALFQFLRAIGLHPLEWSQAVEFTGKASPYIGEVLETAFSVAQAAIILFTPDDEARLREDLWSENEQPFETKLTGQARPNVIFEAGMAMGMYPDRTLLCELGELRPISDLGGRHVIRLNNSVSRRQELAQRLAKAGCNVNLGGLDWHDEGDFTLPRYVSKVKTVLLQNPVLKTKSSVIVRPNEKQKTESSSIRLDRILQIKNVKQNILGKINIKSNDFERAKQLNLQYRQGDFQCYTKSERPNLEIFYISNPYNQKIDFQKELADIRVLIETNSKIEGLNFRFIIVTNNDESDNKEKIKNAFEKMKSFVVSKSPTELLIWDDNELTKIEWSLGIKVDI